MKAWSLTPAIVPALMAIGIGVATGLAACGNTGNSSTFPPGDDGGAGDDGSNTFADGAGGDGTAVAPDGSSYACPSCPAFPPIGAPECAPATLGPPSIAYPIDGILLPPNMNVLEVQFVPPQGATLFEVDFENGLTDVRVETQCAQVPDVRGGTSRGCGVTLPQGAWNDVANKNRDGDPVHVTVRATVDGSCVTTTTAKIDVSFAKEDLAGGIYYWQSAVYGGIGGKTGGIYSHDFGTFDPTPTPFYTSGGTGTCVGCHNLSRDGSRMALATDDPDGDDEFADVKTHVMDVATRTVLGGATMSPGFQTFTHDHTKMIGTTFKTSKNLAFAVFDGDGATLLSTQTLAGGIAATQPDLSSDDKTLVYVVPKAGTIDKAGDHHFKAGSIYTSTFDAATNAVGAPTSLLTAAGRNYYYPSFSPNVTFVIMNDAPDAADTATSNGDAFTNRGARVKLLHYPPAASATPIDLPALNVADGLTNSWPRWSPFVQTYKGHKLLWVTFSSNRDYGLHLVNKGFDNCYPPEGPTYDQPQPLSKQNTTYANCAQPQIWMAAVLVDEDGALDASDRSFPAFWLPFQDVNSHNHSAQWVEKVQGGPPPSPDGGADAAGACSESGQACGAGCCSDVVCCLGTCQFSCIR
jgi:hypothetical protein